MRACAYDRLRLFTHRRRRGYSVPPNPCPRQVFEWLRQPGARELNGRSAATVKQAFDTCPGATLAVFVFLLSSAHEAMAQQSVEDLFRRTLFDAAETTNLGNAFQSLSIFGVTPGISAAVFNADQSQPGSELTIQTLKLPLSHQFAPIVAGIRPYGELTLGYGHADNKVAIDLVPGQQTKVNADYDTYSALAGMGATVPFGSHVSLRPIFLAGYSRIVGDANFNGPFADELEAASSGLLTDLTINTLLLGGALEARLAWHLNESIEFGANARYNHFYARNFDASESVLETADDFGVLTVHTEVDGPIPLTIFGRETRWIGFVGYTYLPGDQKDALDFDYFFEVGAGAAILDSGVIEGLSGLSLHASLIVGEDVHGWSAGLALEF